MPKVYLPWVPGPAVDVGGQGETGPCGMTAVEDAVFRRLRDHPGQERGEIRCDARLVRAARARCELFRQVNGLAEHYPQGINPHATVEPHGYDLPGDYPEKGQVNYIESAAVGQRPEFEAKGLGLGEEVVAAWLASEKHRWHVLGQHAFYRAQVVWGVGYSARPSARGWAHWWCLLTCHPE